MEKSILLESRHRAFYVFASVSFLVIGVSHFITSDQPLGFRTGLAFFSILVSLAYGIQSIFGFSIHSKYAARFRATDNFFELKTNFWGPMVTFEWEGIRSIKFSDFKVEFKLKDCAKPFKFNMSSIRYEELKKQLKESADQHNIQVIGG